MTLVSAPQHFTLGVLKSNSEILSPKSTRIELRGRGMLCRVAIHYEFEEVTSEQAQLFAFECPWNAALSQVRVNGEKAPAGSQKLEKAALAQSLKAEAESVCQGRNSQSIACWIEANSTLKTLEFEFVLSLELLWYQGELKFSSPEGECEIDLSGVWNLAGLTGAALTLGGACADFRLETLEASKFRIKGLAKLGRGESASFFLKLDEKRPASLCLYAPPSEDGSRPGCSAVAVVAPVRPQLTRDAVNLAVLVEVRSPQEGLVVRELIERITQDLKEGDRISLRVLGKDSSQNTNQWLSPSDVDEVALAAVLEPTSMGRVHNLTEALKDAVPSFKGVTHLVVATPGSSVNVGGTATLGVPSYFFGTGRHPSLRELDALATNNTGFVCAQHLDGIESFLARLKIRLGAPLLSDFKLEGWGVEDTYPKGRTHVFMDRPTLSMGHYTGLLPSTVILGGLSPTGSRLAQRVKVEEITDFDFLSLYQRKVEARQPKLERLSSRTVGGVVIFEMDLPVEPTDVFEFESDSKSSLSPPTMDPITSAVSLEGSLFGAPEPVLGGADLFAGPAELAEVEDDFFGSPDFESDIFDSAPEDSSGAESGEDLFGESSMPIIQADPESPFDAPIVAPPEKTQQLLYVGDIQAHQDEASQEIDPFESSEEEDPFGFEDSSSLLNPVFESSPSAEVENPLESPSQESKSTLEQESESASSAETMLHVKLVKDPVGGIDEDQDSQVDQADKKSSKSSRRLLSWKDKPPEEAEEQPNLTLKSSEEATPQQASASSSSGWVDYVSRLEQESVQAWLASCSIDDIALGLVGQNREELSEKVLSSLSGPRKQAILTQMELAQFLEADELVKASENLDRLLLQET